MSLFEVLVITSCAFLLLLLTADPICNFVAETFSYDGGHDRRLSAFYCDARSRGLSYMQANDELYLRTALAKLRRTASDAVRYSNDKSRWHDCIQWSTRDVVDKVAAERPDLLAPFAATLASLTYGDILYSPECRIVDELVYAPALGRVSADEGAAIIVIR